MLFNSQDGIQLGLFGLQAYPANHGHTLGSDTVQPMSGTSGLSSTGSFASDILSASLAKMLQVRLTSDGLMEYSETWKRKATPAGRLYWAHIASRRRIYDNEFTGWLTPKCHSGGGQEERLTPGGGLRKLEDQVLFIGWPTPNVPNGGRSITHAEMNGVAAYRNGKKVQVGLEAVAKMAGWGTPSATERSGQGDANVSLMQQVRMTQLASGTPTTLSPVETAKSGASLRSTLNPAFSLWMMGFPPSWMQCGVEAMALCIPLRRRKSQGARIS